MVTFPGSTERPHTWYDERTNFNVICLNFANISITVLLAVDHKPNTVSLEGESLHVSASVSASVTTARGILCGSCVCARVISDSSEKAQALSALFPFCFHRLAGVRRSVSRSMPSVTQQPLNTITGGLSPARRPIRNKEVSVRGQHSDSTIKPGNLLPLRGQCIVMKQPFPLMRPNYK